MRTGKYILPLGGAVLTGAVGIAAYVAGRINGPGSPPDGIDGYTFSPWELDVPHESVSFQSQDGLTLRGWWFPRPDSRSVIIGCPGHRRGKHDLLGIGSFLWRAGHNVLLFDFRGCWDSDPGPSSLAYKEMGDLRAAIQYADERVQGAGIGLLGYSMGGAVAILVAASDPRVRAVVADSAFATMRDIIAHQLRRRRCPPHPVLTLTDYYNRVRYGYRFHAVRPLDLVDRISPRPVLIIHGRKDVVTPVGHAYKLYDAAREPKELWIVENAGHCGAYFDDRASYVRRVTRFYAGVLEPDEHDTSASA